MATHVPTSQLNLPIRLPKLLDHANTTTFHANLSLPLHRWFRFSAGFSADWVRQVINTEKHNGRTRVLDPFAGSGTVLLEGELEGVESIGVEAHPLISRIAKAKLEWRSDADDYQSFALAVVKKAKRYRRSDLSAYPDLVRKCYTETTLTELDSLKRSWETCEDGTPVSELTWLTLIGILRECASVGTAQWQYILPRKTKRNPLNPFTAFEAKAQLFHDDMKFRQTLPHGPRALHYEGDARLLSDVDDGWADLVITSPPYANNYDYADATRLEMSFLGDITGWGDLQETVRKYLIRSCTQHAAPLTSEVSEMLTEPVLAPIRKELSTVCEKLNTVRAQHGGNKPYHAMISAYFLDMAKVFHALRRVTSKRGLMCFVIGDSAPYGIYVPVDKWLGQLAVSAGFKRFSFEKTRDRNIKWKNRKHRVPLHEGRLWIES